MSRLIPGGNSVVACEQLRIDIKYSPVEVRMNEEGGRHGTCAIALLENVGGAAKVSRQVDFHQGHQQLDRAYNWGMRWKAGSK